MTTSIEKTSITCDHCGKGREVKPTAKGEPRLPGGWKRHQATVWCDTCWRASFCLRAVTIPIAGPVGDSWDDLRAALKSCWQDSTRLANWVTTELAKADVVRLPEHEKIPAFTPPYLYPHARQVVPTMDPQSVTAHIQAVTAKYRARRYETLWLGRASLPNYRYPTPYPVHNQGWSVDRGEGGECLLSVRLAGRRWSLRLRGGREFGRQLGAVRQLIAGEAVSGELAIYTRPASSGDHRNGVETRDAGGGQRQANRVMAKMVMWLPKQVARDAAGTLHVRTDADAMLVYHVEGQDRIHRLHADHVRQWVAEHRRKNQRIADDLKYEKRWPTRIRKRMVESQQSRLRKQHRRMDAFAHEVSAMLAGFARRQKVASVLYDDRIQTYVESFPWHDLAAKIETKLSESNIAFSKTSGDVVTETPSPLEQE